ncbi:MAG: phasin family protein [Rhodospirillales bacterium]
MAMPPEMFDISKFFKGIDPAKMSEEMSKMLGQYKVPGVDMDAIVASQKKNVEALVAANRTVVEGLQAVMRRQGEILQETMGEVTKAVQGLGKSASSPQDLVAAQADLAKKVFEKSLSSMREIAELVAKSQTDATQHINARISATLDELKQSVLKVK